MDIEKIMNVLLLGRNRKDIRVMAAHLLRGLYIAEKKVGQKEVFWTVLDKINEIKTYGVNS